ncbi:Aste57867_22443 [Aphanomyces stellatus]|uniref:Aste57867_22443 protein n=1 Tax=Aphanomyces stellatus TaxID=120398 RepID=A0A485LK35_9STRA|nr:hypothetical protein As57867_022373 [Aphanomyces stellatus]VFT99103.1 Aste57867_22443 [Aphanomyces stellatus]
MLSRPLSVRCGARQRLGPVQSVGVTLLILAALINVIVPLYYVLRHVYHDNGQDSHDMALLRKEASSRRMVLTKQMTIQLEEEGSIDMDDHDLQSTEADDAKRDAFYFDMTQFRKNVPEKAIGVDRVPTLKLEAMSKGWISLVFFFLVFSTFVCLVIFAVPASVDTDERPLVADGIAPLNATAYLINASLSTSLPHGSRFLSVLADVCHHVDRPASVGGTRLLLNVSYDMRFAVDAHVYFQSFVGYTLVQCDCSPVCALSSAYAPAHALTLVSMPWYQDQFHPFATPAPRRFSFSAVLDLRHPVTTSFDRLNFSLLASYSAVYPVVDGTKLAFMGGDLLALVYWIYINRHVAWHRMLPERRLLFVLLACNVLGSGPMMQLLKLVFSDALAYLVSQSWVVTLNAAWLLGLLIMIDQQRHRSFSVGLWLAHGVPAVVAVTLRHLAFYFCPAAVTSLVDVGLSIVALWIFRAVVMSTRNTLRRRPYAATRANQLTARVLYIMSYSVPYVYFFAALAADPLPVVHGYIGTTKTLTNLPTQIAVRAATFVLFLIFLPPTRHERSAMAACVVTTRATQATRTFCIETACALYNLSCHAYYAAPGLKHEPLDMDMDNVALAHDQVRALAALYDAATDTHGVVFVDDMHRIVVAFRGTASTANAITDLTYNFVAPDLWTDDHPDIRLHAGFWAAYCSVRDQLHAVLGTHADKPWHFTGHSLGGALATIAAFDAGRHFHRHVTMYNYGSPRVGNHAFAKVFSQYVTGFRVVNDGDIIVGGPKRAVLCLYCVSSLRYKHVGTAVLLSERANGTFIVDPNIVETAFIAQLRGSGFSHFLSAYKLRLQKGLRFAAVLDTDKSKASSSVEHTPLLDAALV